MGQYSSRISFDPHLSDLHFNPIGTYSALVGSSKAPKRARVAMTEKSYASAVAVERAVDVLTQLAEKGEMSVSELSSSLGIGKTAIHRILTAFTRKGLVDHDDRDERYRLSWRILTLTRGIARETDLRSAALPAMMKLRDLTQETVSLHVRSDFSRICVEEVDGLHELRWRAEVGSIGPLYAGAGGKTLLTHLSDPERKRYYRRVKRPKLTRNTVTDEKAIENELAEIREQGFAVSHGDRLLGGTGIAAPVYDVHGTVVGAMTIAAPTERCTPKALQAWIPAVVAAARQVSQLLGHEEAKYPITRVREA